MEPGIASGEDGDARSTAPDQSIQIFSKNEIEWAVPASSNQHPLLLLLKQILAMVSKSLLQRFAKPSMSFLHLVMPVVMTSLILAIWAPMTNVERRKYGVGAMEGLKKPSEFCSKEKPLVIVPQEGIDATALKQIVTNAGIPESSQSWYTNSSEAIEMCQSSKEACWGIVTFENAYPSSPNWEYTLRFRTCEDFEVDENDGTQVDQGCVPSTEQETAFPGVGRQPYVTSGFLSLQWSIDAAIIAATNASFAPGTVNLGSPAWHVQAGQFTSLSADEVKQHSNLFFLEKVWPYLGPCMGVWLFAPTAYILTAELVLGKETKMTQSLRIMGLNPAADVFSSIIVSLALMMPPLLICSAILHGTIFFDVPYGQIASNFVAFGLSVISLSFFVSAGMQQKADVAGGVTLFILVALTGGGVAIQSATSPSMSQRVWLSLVSPFAFVFMNIEFANCGNGEMASRGGCNEPSQKFQLMCLLDSAIYTVLFLYLNEVYPRSAASRPLSFPFSSLKSILLKRKKVAEELLVQNCSGIFISGLNKEFVTDGMAKRALDNLTFQIQSGSVLSLLGHNGAGKTTTMSILTGLLKPTSGKAYLGGCSITNMPRIRKQLGLCPQHDILWPDITVRHMLQIVGTIKGIPLESLKTEVTRWLFALGIPNKANTVCSALSGGQRRKVSLAAAMIGGSKFVLLDEPTSGMDPLSRRNVWDVIQKCRHPDRTIVLSTHYLDEADQLGDSIAIMSKGSLRAQGSSSTLKRQFGIGYTIVVLMDRQRADVAQLEALLVEHVAGCRLVGDAGSEVAFQIPESSRREIPNILRSVEKSRARLAISDFGITMTTLEDVFLRIVNEGKYLDEEAECNNELGASLQQRVAPAQIKGRPQNLFKKASSSHAKNEELKQNWSRSFRVLAKKRISEHHRRWKTLAIYTVIASSFLALACFLMQLIGFSPFGCEKNFVSKPPKINLFPQSKQSALYEKISVAVSQNWQILDSAVIEASKLDLQTGSKELIDYVMNNRKSSDAFISDCCQGTKQNTSIFTENRMIHLPPMVSSALLNSYVNLTDSPFSIIPSSWPMSFKQVLSSEQESSLTSMATFAIVLVFAISILPASLPVTIIKERQAMVLRQLRMSGSSATQYWTAVLGSDICVTLPLIALMVSLTAIFTDSRNAILNDWYGPSFFIASFVLFFASIVVFNHAVSFAFKSYESAFGILFGYHAFVGFIWIVVMINVTIQTTLSGLSKAAAISVNSVFFFASPVPAYVWSIWVQANFGFIRCGESYPLMIDTIGLSIFFMLFHVIGGFMLILFLDYQTSRRLSFKGTNDVFDGKRHLDQEDSDVQHLRSATFSNHFGRTVDSESDMQQVPLVVKGLRKVYPPASDGISRIAVASLTLSVERGTCLALLGPNGAGKSTALSMMCGDLLPSHGDIQVAGVNLHDKLRAGQQKIGLCPQFDALVPELSVVQQLRLHAILKGISDEHVEKNVADLMDRLDLKGFANTPCGVLSGGNKRRVSFAIAILGNPPVLLLDEPSSGMDPAGRRFMWNLIVELRNKGAAIILTSHDMAEVSATCTHISILVDGQMRCFGTPQRIKSRYGQGYSVELCGSLESRNESTKQITSSFPKSCIAEQRAGWTRLHIPAAGEDYTKSQTSSEVQELDVAALFECVQESAEQSGIKDLSVTQATLEQVFLRFAKQQQIVNGTESIGDELVNPSEFVSASEFQGSHGVSAANICWCLFVFNILPALPMACFALLFSIFSCWKPAKLASNCMWKLTVLQCTPFGRRLDSQARIFQATGSKVPDSMRIFVNFLWFCSFGIVLAIVHFAQAVVLGLTVVLAPFAKAHFDMCNTVLTPW